MVNLRDHGPEDRAAAPGRRRRAVEDVADEFGFELGFVEAGRAPYYDDAAAHRELDALVATSVPRGEPCPRRRRAGSTSRPPGW